MSSRPGTARGEVPRRRNPAPSPVLQSHLDCAALEIGDEPDPAAQRTAGAVEEFCLVRFEEVLQAPRETIERLSAWLGVEFEDDMLNVAVINGSFTSEAAAGA